MIGDGNRGNDDSLRGLADLGALLVRDAAEWRAILDERYGVLDEVLAGRRRAVICPAASMGRTAASALAAMGVEVAAFGDSDPTLRGRTIDGVPVLSLEEIARDHPCDVVLVASTMYESVIREVLHAGGCEPVVPVGYLNLRLPQAFPSREYAGSSAAVLAGDNRPSIEAAHALLADDESRRVFVSKLAFFLSFEKRLLEEIRSSEEMYFGSGVLELATDEIVVDGGAYVGDTLQSFLRVSSGRFEEYHAFEPDSANYAHLARVASDDPERIHAVRAGLGIRSHDVRLLSTAGADSRVLHGDEPGGETIAVVGLDEYFEGRPAPTLLKMDIEGSEADALLGASGLLASHPPKLAVSVYHYPSDLWTIPLLISRLMPDCGLYLRHYSREIDDTVCYAVPAPSPAK